MGQGDMMIGLYVLVNGKKKPSYLFAFMDDCSRLVTFARFSLEQNFEAMKRVYAASKGKIERFFRTVRERFLPLLSYPVTSLDELNQFFWRWLEEDYHRRTHSALGMSPLDKYLSPASQLKVVKDPAEVNRLFMRWEKRRVNNDAAFSLAGRLFEVPCTLIGPTTPG